MQGIVTLKSNARVVVVDTIQFFAQKGTPLSVLRLTSQTPLRETQPQSQNQRNVLSYAHFENKNRTTVTQVVKAKLQLKGGKIVEANVVFDGGSDLSFVAQDLVKKLDLKKSGEETFSFSGFGDAESGPRTKRKVYTLNLGVSVLNWRE